MNFTQVEHSHIVCLHFPRVYVVVELFLIVDWLLVKGYLDTRMCKLIQLLIVILNVIELHVCAHVILSGDARKWIYCILSQIFAVVSIVLEFESLNYFNGLFRSD